ncbi:MAG: PatB family C-S lyase [Paracoccaceae bacterium]|nr:PatB family C-S lyase [Paracoccaceae bacterium]
MTQFDFDKPVDRRAVPALKTHRIVLGDGGEQFFAAGVADMDFEVAPPIMEALRTRLDHSVFGYEAVPGGLVPALQNWLSLRHGWDVPAEQILRAPNALNSLAMAVSLFTGPGDGIIVQPPVFFDFYDIIRENHRTLVRNPLILDGGRYELDFDGFEALAAQPASKILLLCNPHNPVGRVWTRAELTRLGDICLRHGILVVSDDLHADIVYPGHTYQPFAAISPAFAKDSVTVLSPAKSFNIASCCSAFTVVPDADRRAAFQAENSRLTVNKNNAFANVAMEAAYREGKPWLEAVIRYIQGNLKLLRDRLTEMPLVNLIEPEATFLAWIDFRGLGLDPDHLHAVLRQDARWAATRGVSFGPEGAGFMRLNIACRRALLAQALDNLEDAVQHS